MMPWKRKYQRVGSTPGLREATRTGCASSVCVPYAKHDGLSCANTLDAQPVVAKTHPGLLSYGRDQKRSSMPLEKAKTTIALTRFSHES